ncbi:MAG: hypothetical protein HPY50_11665 [Firmicutes bacterium]|nr:hypothetical protein [Bacillota bacterium]
MITIITWNSAASVTSVTDAVYGSTPLTVTTDYTVVGSTLTILDDYLSGLSLSEGDTLDFDITFDTGAAATLTVHVVNGYVPGNDADLSGLSVNGTPVSGFDPGDIEYNVELPYGTASAIVTATASDPNAQVSITQAPSLPGSAAVTVTAEDGTTTRTYTINLTVGAPASIPVTGITVTGTGGAESVQVGSTLQMLAEVLPANATNQNVTWSIEAGSGATISAGGLLTATSAGSVTVRATAQDGSGVYGEKEITITTAPPAFVAVTGITDVPTAAAAGVDLTLAGTVAPANATNQTIVWSVKDAGTTGATISGNTLSTTAAGTVTVKATITNGASESTDYTQDFNITVNASAPVLVTSITVTAAGNAATVANGSTLQMSAAVLPADAADKSVTWSVVPGTGTAAIDQNGLLTGTGAGKVTVQAAANDGSGITGSLLITVTNPVTATSAPIEITSTPTSITVPSDVTDASLTVSTTGGDSPQATLPLVQVNNSTALGNIQLNIPDATTITGPSGWNGDINLPTVESTDVVTPPSTAGYTSTVQTVIEVGYGDVKLTFDKAVRLLIPGQAGKSAGYSRGGVFTPIPRPAGAQDSQSWADNYITTPDGDYAVDVSSDLVIWTRHFTRFVTYTQTAVSGPSGGGGGGGNLAASAPVVQTSAATSITLDAAVLNGSITSDRGHDITGCGFLWGTSAGSLTNKLDAGGSIQSGSFAATLGSLTAGTTYYFKAYATNLGGTSYGSVLSFTTASPIIAPALPAVPVFSDVPATFWGYTAITSLSGQGCIAGYPDGTFRPDSTITRAEFSVVVVRAFKLPAQSGKVFSDTSSHWARDYISTAYASGIIRGYDENTFGPDDPITREQMTVMIANAAKLLDKADISAFTDCGQISPWAGDSVAEAVKNGSIKGYPDGSFRPQGHATRAEAMTVIANSIK